ncbi:MAG: T9SS type A sorting domain-containing protein [Bacteroidetes bacterium]|nr:T9SS type A sorting domain-containing protein [Bacteroidota bacterium]
MIRSFTIMVFLLFSKNILSQNLISNPGFEDTLDCWTWWNNGNLPALPCIGWYESIGTADFWSLSYTQGCGTAPFPNNPTFGYQKPRNGDCCVGFGFLIFPNGNDRECITSKLVDSCKYGRNYQVSFYVNAANNAKIVIDKIGAYFSKDSLNPDSNYMFKILPQIENQSGNILLDTANWMQVKGSFIAKGGEQFITIGCFRPDSNLTIDSTNNWSQPLGYYFLDDISVIDCTASSINEVAALEIQLLNNAATHTLTVTCEGISAYNIITMDGKTILSQHTNVPQPKIEIDIGTLARGIYIVQVADKRKRVGYKKFGKY